MASNVEIEMDALKKRLQKMRDNLSNSSPTMQKVSVLMYKDVMNHFKDESGPKGSWPKLSSATEENRRKGKGSGSAKKLQDTGMLRNSIKAENTKNEAKVGTNLIYAPIHNYGGTIPARRVEPKDKQALRFYIGGQAYFSKGHDIPATKIPQRKFLWISKSIQDQIKSIIGKFVIGDGT